MRNVRHVEILPVQEDLALIERAAKTGLWRWSPASRTLHLTPGLCTLLNIPPHEGSSSFRGLIASVHVSDRNALIRQIAELRDGKSPPPVQFRVVDRDGTMHLVRQTVGSRGERGDDDDVEYAVFGVARDVTEEIERENAIREEGNYDSVTHLPNRRRLMEHLEWAVRIATRHQRLMSVLFIDLDGFKQINDSFGHKTGDLVLEEVARRLGSIVRDSDFMSRPGRRDEPLVVARFGGDEFVIVLSEVKHREDPLLVADRIQRVLAEPYDAIGPELSISASVGIAAFPEDGTHIEQLLTRADLAMYAAKEKGGRGHVVFHEALGSSLKNRLELENALRYAVERDELSLEFQPRLDLQSGKVVGAEALLRWTRSDGRRIAPSEFIPIAERSGSIDRIGLFVIENVSRQIQAWEASLPPGFRISVNVSTRQLADESFFENLRELIDRFRISPERLEIELTESALVGETPSVVSTLDKIRQHGITLALDDFGTGFSSLGLLTKVPLDVLKIDRSFIAGLPDDGASLALTTSILAMAQAFRLRVVAEGVERNEQREFLSMVGCDEIQGYLVSKPVAPESLVPLLARFRAGLAVYSGR